jgi:hypothetical protein
MMNNLPNELPKNKTICLPFNEKEYLFLVSDAQKYRKYLNRMIEAFPELFPPEIEQGYQMKDKYNSRKLYLTMRRIRIGKESYTIRPSFVMPYMTGETADVEKVLFLRKFGVPFWALTHVFGHDDMHWYRMERSLGRNSIVGTTINDPEKLPEHLCADEKHNWLQGKRVYLPTTVGNDCILGVDIAKEATADALHPAYGRFKQEAQQLQPDYSPKTVNMDGWEATRNAWKALFPRISIIFCILHIFIAIRDRAKKKFKDIFTTVADKFWDAYKAECRRSFSQRLRRLHEWAMRCNLPTVIVEKLAKLQRNLSSYAQAYCFPGSHRTSNMLERIMRLMDRHLFFMQYFHRSLDSAKLSIRAWALIYNFAPWNPCTSRSKSASTPL